MAGVAGKFGDSMADEEEVCHLGRPVSAVGALVARQLKGPDTPLKWSSTGESTATRQHKY